MSFDIWISMSFDTWMALLFILVGTINVLWYVMKFILMSKGYEVHLFWSHWSDIGNMQDLVKNEPSPEYKRILTAFYVSLGALGALLCFLLFAIAIGHL